MDGDHVRDAGGDDSDDCDDGHDSKRRMTTTMGMVVVVLQLHEGQKKTYGIDGHAACTKPPECATRQNASK